MNSCSGCVYGGELQSGDCADMNQQDFEDSSPELLRRLLAIDTSVDEGWGDDELKVAWGHVLQMPVGALLRVPQRGRGIRATEQVIVRDLLRGADPRPIEELFALKECAKAHMAVGSETSVGFEMPPQVASVLYHVVILLARQWHGRWISSISDAAFTKGICWAEQQPWLDERTRAIFSQHRATPK